MVVYSWSGYGDILSKKRHFREGWIWKYGVKKVNGA